MDHAKTMKWVSSYKNMYTDTWLNDNFKGVSLTVNDSTVSETWDNESMPPISYEILVSASDHVQTRTITKGRVNLQKIYFEGSGIYMYITPEDPRFRLYFRRAE